MCMYKEGSEQLKLLMCAYLYASERERITHPLRTFQERPLSQSSYIFINKNNQIMSSFPISSLMPTFQ